MEKIHINCVIGKIYIKRVIGKKKHEQPPTRKAHKETQKGQGTPKEYTQTSW